MGLRNWLTAFLKRFFAVFCERPGKSSSGTADNNKQLSYLSRYIYQSGHFSKANRRVKQGAFLPDASKLKISAVWIDDLPDLEIWDIGDLLGSKRPSPAKTLARADFDAATLPEAKLTSEPDPVPHPRHVNLCGWPKEKDAQKAIALILCSRSTLQIR